MKGDFSRQTFDPTRHYDAVLMQQGRVQVDADWNEEGAIARYRRDTETGDVIGPRGTPRDGTGFAVGLSGDAQDLTLGPGRMYVDSILCELGAAASYRGQPDFDPPAGPAAEGFALLYLDVWQRLATALDDPHIRETALGGPDTAARLQTVWQAKLAPWAGQGTPKCGDFGPGWTPAPPPDGLLTASTADPGAGTSGPCVLPPTAGYQRLENQLYRVEIQQGGPLGTATFKWSRDNGSVVTGILAISGNDLTVQDVGPDDVLGFAAGQWAEVADDTAERDSGAGHLVQIAAVDPGTRIITIAAPGSPLPAFDPARHPKLRRWDQTTGDESGIVAAAGPLDLEGGVQVAFSAGSYRAGDYWLIPARTAITTETGDIEWPRQPDGTPIAQPPAGIAHHYCPLALVQVAGGVFSLVADGDCRRPFPPLTDIQASDVGYDGSGCAGALGLATTVQQALDALCGASWRHLHTGRAPRPRVGGRLRQPAGPCRRRDLLPGRCLPAHAPARGARQAPPQADRRGAGHAHCRRRGDGDPLRAVRQRAGA